MKVIIAASQTGGHINPGIAIANKIKEENKDAEIIFIGTKRGLENDLVPRAGYKLRTIEAYGIVRKISIDNFKKMLKTLKGYGEAKKILKEEKPDIVIGTGGFICGPVLLAAAKQKIPTMLHESNAFPGVTVKLLAKKVDTILIGFEDARAKIHDAKNIVLTGTPTKFKEIQYSDKEKEEFLKENGFESKEDFINYLTLTYKRDLYYVDYLKTKIDQDEIQKYYDENVYGEINTKHILVETSDEVTDEQAKAKAKEIIAKLDSGKTFDEVAEEYGDAVIYEDLGYNGFDSSLATEYVEASKALENGTYSKEPVKTDFGYHVIYKVDQKDKPSLEEATNSIVKILGKDLESEDSYIKYKALIKMREDNKLEFKDSKYKEEYKEYCEQLNDEK